MNILSLVGSDDRLLHAKPQETVYYMYEYEYLEGKCLKFYSF